MSNNNGSISIALRAHEAVSCRLWPKPPRSVLDWNHAGVTQLLADHCGSLAHTNQFLERPHSQRFCDPKRAFPFGHLQPFSQTICRRCVPALSERLPAPKAGQVGVICPSPVGNRSALLATPQYQGFAIRHSAIVPLPTPHTCRRCVPAESAVWASASARSWPSMDDTLIPRWQPFCS